MTLAVEINEDNLEFVSNSSKRKQYIRSLIDESNATSRIPNIPSDSKSYDVISVEIEYLLYNVHNTRVKSFLQDNFQIYDYAGSSKVDDFINEKYEEINEPSLQYLLHKYLFEEEAQTVDVDIYQQIKNAIDTGSDNPQGDFLIIDNQGIVIDGNRRLSVFKELTFSNLSAESLKTINCIVYESETNRSTPESNKELENKLNLQRNVQKKHHFIDQDSELKRQFNTEFDPEEDNSEELYLKIAIKNELIPPESTDTEKKNHAKNLLERHQTTMDYLKFMRDFGPKDFKLSTLKSLQIQFDMEAMRKAYLAKPNGPERELRKLFGFAFISGHKYGGLAGASYKLMNTETKFANHLNAFQVAYRCRDIDKGIEKIKTEIISQDVDEWKNFTEKVIDKRRELDDQKDIEDRNRQVLDNLIEISSTLVNTDILIGDTILNEDVHEAISKVNNISELLSQKKDALEELN